MQSRFAYEFAADPLKDALRRARVVNRGRDPTDVSFTSLFVGVAAGRDDVGRWLRDRFAESPGALAALLRRAGLTQESFDDLSQRTPPEPLEGLSLTASASRVLDRAREIADEPPDGVGTVEVLAALLTLPEFHLDDFRSMGIDRDAWARQFQPTFVLRMETPEPTDSRPRTEESGASGGLPNLSASGVRAHVGEVLRLADALAQREVIAPRHIVDAIRIADAGASPSFRRFLAQLPPRAVEASLPPLWDMPDVMRFLPALRRQIARAQRTAANEGMEIQIWGRDVIAAVLLCPDLWVQDALGGDADTLEAVRDDWYGYVMTEDLSRPRADWAAWWREAGLALPQPRRAVYSLESDEGQDRLGVGPEARAFARLILDKDVKPPLSIALLGDWGSGKSFFIEQIRQNIASLAGEGRTELHASVVQIEFNAWHASDANLWASLVTNIFDEIWHKVSPTGDSRDLRAARETLEGQIRQARGAVHEAETQVETGRAALAQAEERLAEKRALLALGHYVASNTRERLDAMATAAGWRAPLDTINDVDDAIRALGASGNRLQTLGASLLEQPVRHIAIPVTVALGLAATAVWWIDAASLSALQQKLSQTLAAVAGVAAAVIAPLKLARGKVDALADGLERVKKGFDEKLKEIEKVDEPHARRVGRARRELASAEESVSVARSRLAELMNRQVALDPVHRLGSFLQERVRSDQYRAQQGIISLVHKDFSELSRYMKDLREAPPRPEGASGEAPIKPIDRIVLYVDDLDRCRPAQVVAMLEAVHLLLALDLFVVVVAVDSRWLMRSLTIHYSELLGTAGDAGELRDSTPQNYLEKIFQITYALAPMHGDHIGEYVDALVGPTVAMRTKDPADLDIDFEPEADVSPPSPIQPAPSAASDVVETVATEAPRPASRPFRPIAITKAERDLIVSLTPLLATPRLTKRLVNVYRVIKAGKSTEELAAFENGRRGTTCLVMLAVLFGRPAIASDLLRRLFEGTDPFAKPGLRLVDALMQRVPADGEPANLTRAWKETTDFLAGIGVEETVADFALEPREVARYSLASGHAWHTWQRRGPSPASPS